MPDFSLAIHPLSPSLPCEGPAPLSLTITYHGKDKTTLPVDDFVEVSFSTPPGWAPRQVEADALKTSVLSGFLPEIALSPEESWSRQVYLHDCFSIIKPGNVRLTARVKIWPGISGSEPLEMSASSDLTISEPDPVRFAARIQAIERQIATEKSAENRQELYQSLASLSHPSLQRIFQTALADPDMLAFHATAHQRLAELDNGDDKND